MWKHLGRLLLLLVLGGAVFVVTWQSPVLNIFVFICFWIVFFFLLRSMFVGDSGDRGLAQKKMAVLLGATALSILGLIAALVLIAPARQQRQRTSGFAKYQFPMTAKEEAYANELLGLLGWGPFDAKGALGMWQTPVDPNREHILVLGDSVLYAWGVEENETTGAYLDEMLPEFQVLNLAVSGWSVDQYYLYLKKTLERTKARLAVIGIFAGNDFQITVREYGWGHSKPYFEVRDGELVHTNPDLLAANCVDQMAQSLLFRHLWTDKFIAQNVLKLLCRAKSMDVDEGKEVVSRLIKKTQEVGDEHGTKVLFLLLPDINDFTHIGSDHYHRLITFYPFFKEVLDKGGHDYIEVANFLGGSAEEVQRSLFIDQGHYTPKGHKQVAKGLRDYIVKNYLTKP